MVGGLRVLREERLQRLEASIARERLAEVLATTPGTQAHALSVEINALAESELEQHRWDEKIAPALHRLESAGDRGDAKEIKAAIEELATILGLELPEDGDDQIIDALADPTVPFALGSKARPSETPPWDRLVERLGQPVEGPAGVSARAIQIATRDRVELFTRPDSGLQIARQGAYGRIYDHHGILLGDGTVVHFSGEAGRQGKQGAAVRRESFDAFLGDALAEDVEAVEPVAVRSREVSALRSSIVCLRSVGAIGRTDYRLLANNCEHFATWATLGGSRSSQVRLAAQLQRVFGLDPQRELLANALAIDDVVTRRMPLPGVASSEGDDPIWFDLGRAYWSPDAGDLACWVPLWESEPALAVADHAWRMGALAGELRAETWSSGAPVVLLDPAWHASLIAVVAGARDGGPGVQKLFWLLPDGQWLSETSTLDDILDPRLAHARALLSGLGQTLLETLDKAHAAITSS